MDKMALTIPSSSRSWVQIWSKALFERKIFFLNIVHLLDVDVWDGLSKLTHDGNVFECTPCIYSYLYTTILSEKFDNVVSAFPKKRAVLCFL